MVNQCFKPPTDNDTLSCRSHLRVTMTGPCSQCGTTSSTLVLRATFCQSIRWYHKAILQILTCINTLYNTLSHLVFFSLRLSRHHCLQWSTDHKWIGPWHLLPLDQAMDNTARIYLTVVALAIRWVKCPHRCRLLITCSPPKGSAPSPHQGKSSFHSITDSINCLLI